MLSTTPWDSYLIRNRIWSYPPNVIVGLTFLDIPLEELFFFVIQTYNTSLLYLLLSKPTFHPVYLRAERRRDNPQGAINERWRFYRLAGQLALAACIRGGLSLFKDGGEGTYLGLITVWACPFLLFLWCGHLAWLLRVDALTKSGLSHISSSLLFRRRTQSFPLRFPHCTCGSLTR